MILTALHCESSFLYRQDKGTARCRLKLEDLNLFGIKLGNIIKIKLFFHESIDSTFFEVLCIAWLNDADYSDAGIIILDDTVRVSYPQLLPTWSQLHCKIVEVFESRVCNSLQVHVDQGRGAQSKQHDPTSLQYACLPVIKDAVIKANSKLGRTYSTVIRRTLPMSPCIITPFSLLANDQSSSLAASHINSSSSNSQVLTLIISVNTQLVEDLLRKLIIPCTQLPSSLVHHGVLLLGPPGVGKSYSVRAVKARCQGWCDVHIHELSIPDLLSHDDPLRYLEKFFTQIFKTIPRISPTSVSALSSKEANQSSKSMSSPLTTDRQQAHSKQSPKSIIYSPLRKQQLVTEDAISAISSKSVGAKSPCSFSHSSPKATSSSSSSPHHGSQTPVKSILERQIHLVIIDEMDALGKLGTQSEEQIAIVSWLCTWFDQQNESRHSDVKEGIYCTIIGTTNRPEDIDVRLRRGGRLGLELEVYTSRQDRVSILCQLLREHCAELLQSSVISIASLDEVVETVVDRLGGYVAADLAMLVTETFSRLVGRSAALIEDGDETAAISTLFRCLEETASVIHPSALKGVRIILPKLTFDDVIGCTEAKKKLARILSFADPRKRELINRYKLTFPGGALLYGPPGNSKTRLISAAAAVYGLPVISLSAADVYSPYVGDAEAEIRKAFRLARQSAPCVLMLDEVDALVTDRGSGGGSGSGSGSGSASAESRVLATLLNEMDGVGESKADSSSSSGGSTSGQLVYVLATTNRLQCIDKALLRKGRFHHIIYIPTPNDSEVKDLIKYFCQKFSLSNDVIQKLCDKIDVELPHREVPISGADIENMCREEAMKLIRSKIESSR